MTLTSAPVLTESLLARCRERAPQYDRDNKFCLSCEWILRDAAAGEVFATGHAEHGNDIPGLLSTAKAERVDGGYKFTGRKAFGNLTPVWTRLRFHAMDTSDPAGPKVVHAFMPRDAKGYTIKDTWDVMGMRATRSDDTILEDTSRRSPRTGARAGSAPTGSCGWWR